MGDVRGAPQGHQRQLAANTIAEFLSSTALFRGVDRSVLDTIAPHLSVFEYPASAVIVRASTPDSSMGILFAGRAAVRQVAITTGSTTTIEEIRIGDSFGEVPALLGTVQSYEIVAEEDSIVLTIGKDVLQQLVTKVAAFGHALARRLATRVVQAQVSGLRRGPTTGEFRSSPTPPPGSPNPVPRVGADDGGFKFVRVSQYDISDRLTQLIPAKVMQQLRLLPLDLRGQSLTVGMVDPYNQAALAELRRLLTAVDVTVVAIGESEFNETFVRLRLDVASGARVGRAHETTPPEALQFDAADSEREAAGKVGVIGDEVVQMASKIVAHAIDRGASDIHIEPDPQAVRVRFRIQGQLVDWDQFIAPSFAKGLSARFKILSGLDITERRLPQDGRIGVRANRRDVDLRVSTLPSSRGEKIVMRLFEAANVMRPLDSIFIEPRALSAVRHAINRPYGAIVVAGPTGSGKSSTLYAALSERKRTRPDTNIITVEDPIEYRLGGVVQVQVNHAVNLGFPQVLRAMLRQDPDVIMVGEVRDDETAQLALEAAMTGHLLLTSLHANNAMGVIQRFENLGCHRALIGQALGLVIVQRLGRKLCRCATQDIPPPILMESLAQRGLVDKAAPTPLPKNAGCADCDMTGFKGRIAVLEVLQMSEQLRAEIMTGVGVAEIEKRAIESGHLIPFRRYATHLMSRQLVTPAEALLTVS